MAENIRLYYSEPRLVETEAMVVDIEGQSSSPELVLDRTLFYPEGGGQPCDLGSIGGVALDSVQESDGRIRHRLSGPLAVERGQSVHLILDAARRRDHREQHSAQHLLSSILLRLFDAPTLSFHLGIERATIDVDTPLLSAEDLAAVEQQVDEVIVDDYPLVTHLCPPEDPGSFPLRKRPPEGEEQLRIVEIDGIDYSPCCGTHVASTAELRLMKILGAERYKGMMRIAFVAGGRAIRDYREVRRIAGEAARAFGSSPAELEEKARRSVERLKLLESSVGELRRERASLEARLAIGGAETSSAPALLRFVDRDAQAAQEAAHAYGELGAAALAASLPDLTVVVADPSAQSLSSRLKPLAAASGGKGGGGQTSFRASFPDAPSLERFLSAAYALLEGRGL